MRNLLLILSLIPALSAQAGDLWTIGTCPSEGAIARNEFKKRLLAAEPDDPLYLPHPFPHTAEKAIEDFLFSHRRAVTAAAPMREDDRRLFEAIDGDTARFVVTKVANWTPARCGPPYGQTDFHFLVRVFDKGTGEEITRAAIAESGRVYQLMHRSEDEEQAAFSMRELPPLAAPDSFPAAEQAQFVQTWGPELRCPALSPCVAFKNAGRSYLARLGKLYLLETERGVAFREALGTPESRSEFLATLEGRPETVVTVGGDRAVIAVPVEE